MGQLEKLHEITRKCSEDLNLYLIGVELKGDRKKPLYVVLADTEKGITVEECTKLSRAIQDEIDFLEGFPEKYRLDVSSPGLDKPLMVDFQFKKNIGKDLILKIKEENKKIIGKLTFFDKNILSIEDENGNVKEYSRDIIIEAKVKLQW